MAPEFEQPDRLKQGRIDQLAFAFAQVGLLDEGRSIDEIATSVDPTADEQLIIAALLQASPVPVLPRSSSRYTPPGKRSAETSG